MVARVPGGGNWNAGVDAHRMQHGRVRDGRRGAALPRAWPPDLRGGHSPAIAWRRGHEPFLVLSAIFHKPAPHLANSQVQRSGFESDVGLRAIPTKEGSCGAARDDGAESAEEHRVGVSLQAAETPLIDEHRRDNVLACRLRERRCPGQRRADQRRRCRCRRSNPMSRDCPRGRSPKRSILHARGQLQPEGSTISIEFALRHARIGSGGHRDLRRQV